MSSHFTYHHRLVGEGRKGGKPRKKEKKEKTKSVPITYIRLLLPRNSASRRARGGGEKKKKGEEREKTGSEEAIIPSSARRHIGREKISRKRKERGKKKGLTLSTTPTRVSNAEAVEERDAEKKMDRHLELRYERDRYEEREKRRSQKKREGGKKTCVLTNTLRRCLPSSPGMPEIVLCAEPAGRKRDLGRKAQSSSLASRLSLQDAPR